MVLKSDFISLGGLLGNAILAGVYDHSEHFAAYEVPELLGGDLHKIFMKDGPAYGGI